MTDTPFQSNGKHTAAAPQADQRVDLWTYVDIARRRWWVPALTVALALFGAWWLQRDAVPMYSAQLVLQKQAQESPLEALVVRGPQGEAIAAEMEIVRSRAVMADVVDSLNLRAMAAHYWGSTDASPAVVEVSEKARNGRYSVRMEEREAVLTRPRDDRVLARAAPGEWLEGPGFRVRPLDPNVLLEPLPIEIMNPERATERLRAAIGVAQVPGTPLIRVSFRSPDPAIAAAVPNMVAAVYREHSTRRAQEASARQLAVVSEQLLRVSDSLQVAQQSLSGYLASARTLDPRSEGEALSQALLTAQDELSMLRFRVRAVENVATALRAPQQTDDVFERMMALGSDYIPAGISLYTRLKEHEEERSRLVASGLTSQEPRVQNVEALIRDVKRQMLRAAEQSLALLRERETAAEQQVARLESRVRDVPARASTVGTLQQRVAAVQRIFDSLVEKYYEGQIALAAQAGGVDIIDPAVPPLSPEPSRTRGIILLALMLGLGAGLVGAILLEYLDVKVREPKQVEQATGVEVIATIPEFSHHVGENGTPVIAHLDTEAAAAESFRALRTILQFTGAERPHVIGVTSAEPSAGKSTVAANLAVALARHGERVLLIDADLRRPTQQNIFRLERVPGLTDVIAGDATFSAAVQQPEGANIDLIACGTNTPNPPALLGGARFRQIIADARPDYDTVVVDLAPVLPVSDALVVAPVMDGLLFVASVDQSNRFGLREAMARLRRVKAPVVGAVLNRVRATAGYGRYSSYGYGEGYGEAPARRATVPRFRFLVKR